MAPIGKPKRIVKRPVPSVKPLEAPEEPIPAGPLFVPKSDPIEVPDWPQKQPAEQPKE